MKALVYNGPRDVTVTDVEDARIEAPTDLLMQATRTNICGSDLHMYEGRTDMEAGRVLGHENLGEVVEIGSGVDRIKVGDMHQLPLTSAPDAYEHFDRRETGGTKAVLSPAETNGRSAR